MDIKSFTVGDSATGLLIDGVDGTPYVGASLTIDSERGIVLEVPYIDDVRILQFKHVKEWFIDRKVPPNLILQTVDGDLGLFGNQWKGYRNSSNQSLGMIRPNELLIGEYDGDLSQPLLLGKVRSRIDGLSEWTSIRSIDFSHITDDQGLIKELNVKAKPVESDTWCQGDATMQIVSEWRTSYPDQGSRYGLNIDDGTVLVSCFDSPRSFMDHLGEQKKVRDLLTLLMGRSIHFRQHKVSSPQVVEKSLVGTVIAKPRSLLISSATVNEYVQPIPKKQDFNWSLANFDEIGVEGLESWAKKYAQWSPKFIFPVVGILSRDKPFAEEKVNILSMAIEAAGMLLGVQPGERTTYTSGKKPRPTTSTYFYRCLEVVNISWGDIAPNYIGLARGLAKTYNATKHYNDGQYPEPEVIVLSSKVMEYLVRLIALHLIDTKGELLDKFRKKPGLLRLVSLHRHLAVSFHENGTAIPYVSSRGDEHENEEQR